MDRDKQKNIVLIGLPGCGKTTAGRLLANSLSRKFIDLDNLIEKKCKMNISQIFSEHGEEGFRNSETSAVKQIADERDLVIACGGGIVKRAINMKLLDDNGIIVFLNPSVDYIKANIDVSNRPLLKNDPEYIYALHRERLPLYEKYADFVINNEDIEPTLEVLKNIANLEQKDKKYAVIGTPISHSLSPYIHIPLLSCYLRKVSYERVEILEGELSQWVTQVRREAIDGFNVTMPHKKSILPLLDKIDEEALTLGSVNTVVNKGGILTGYNTDGRGFTSAVNYMGINLKEKKLVIIGSGGVAETIAVKSAMEGIRQLVIVARNKNRGEYIKNKIQKLFGTECNRYDFNELYYNNKIFNKADIVTNTTPLGMSGIDENFIDFQFLEKFDINTMLIDLIYSPKKTMFLQRGEAKGLNVIGGLQMLIYQAILADCHYLGLNLNLKSAYSKVRESLKRKVEIL